MDNKNIDMAQPFQCMYRNSKAQNKTFLKKHEK